MNNPGIAHRSREDTTAEGGTYALAQIYKFVLDKQRAAQPAAPENAERSLNAVRVEDIIQERP
jgi:hypothetical protein